MESVLRVFAVIEYLAERDDWVGLRTLARDLDLVPATAHRYLTSLKHLGYVQQHPQDSRYQLSLRIVSIASRVLERIHLQHIVRPWMKELTAIINETTHLAVLDGREIVFIEKVDSNQAVQMRSRAGSRAHLHSTASGRALLAFLPDDERDSILADLELPALTSNTITDRSALIEQLELIRERGYAMDDEENEVGIRCVGVPIFDHTGHVAGAISISGWKITMTLERLPELALRLQDTCRAISRELGHVPRSSDIPYAPATETPG